MSVAAGSQNRLSGNPHTEDDMLEGSKHWVIRWASVLTVGSILLASMVAVPRADAQAPDVTPIFGLEWTY